MGSNSSHAIDDDTLEEIRRNTNFSAREIRDMYDKFRKDFPEGIITRERFVDMYSMLFPDGDPTRFAMHVFRAYDADGNGVIDFHEFMQTLSIAAKGNMKEKLQWAFRLYDLDGSGAVSRQEATEMIMAIYRMQGATHPKDKADQAALQLFVYLDKNKDDSISETEFIDAIQNCSAIRDILQAGM